MSLFIIVSGVGIAVWEGSASEASIAGIILCILGEQAARILLPGLVCAHPPVGCWHHSVHPRFLGEAARGPCNPALFVHPSPAVVLANI